MTIRTFRQRGEASPHTDPVTITAKIDGVEVFSGLVPTEWVRDDRLAIDYAACGPDCCDRATFESDPVAFSGNVLIVWEKPVEFEGTVDMEISVQGGPFTLTQSHANYRIDEPHDAPHADFVLGNEEYFGPYYFYHTADDVCIQDPISDVEIDGVPQNPVRGITDTGQWVWVIPGGSTFTCKVNILPGYVAPVV